MKTIRKGDNAAVFQTTWPAGWKDHAATVRLTVKDAVEGTTLVDNVLVNPVLASTATITSAAPTGSFSVVLHTDRSYKEGMFVITGSDANGWRTYEVDGYDSVTKRLSFTTGILEALPIGSLVRCANYSYTADTAAWTARTLYVHWSPSAGGMPFAEEYKVLSATSAIPEIERLFEAAFPALYTEIERSFEVYERRARESLRKDLERKGRDIQKIINTDGIKESIILEIAYFAAIATNLAEEHYQRILKARESERQKLDALAVWVDGNEDGKIGPGEISRAIIRNFSRGIGL